MPAPHRLPWPTEADVLPVEPLRPVLERLASLALRHGDDVVLLPALVDDEGEADEAADPPPALEQVLEEFGGIELRGRVRLDLLVDERTELGPYTLLGDATTYYPLYEGSDVAVVLTIAGDGTPGAVYGIGEDLSLTLAARDLGAFLERWADALTASLDELDAEVERRAGASEADRAEAAEELMEAHLLRTVLGTPPERVSVPVVPVAPGSVPEGLPAGTIAVADLRDAPLDATVDVMDAELPGDPLDHHLAWAHGGQVVAVVEED